MISNKAVYLINQVIGLWGNLCRYKNDTIYKRYHNNYKGSDHRACKSAVSA